MDLLRHFEDFLATRSPEQGMDTLLACPALLWSDRWPELDNWIDAQPDDLQARARAGRGLLTQLARHFQTQSAQLASGIGPVARLVAAVEAGQIGMSHALAQVRSAATQDCLSPLYLMAAAHHAQDLAHEGEIDPPLLRFRLLLTALDASSPALRDAATASVVLAWIDALAGILVVLADGRLLADASRRGQALAATAAADGQTRLLGTTHHRLGVLHLDPYTAGRTSQDYAGQIQRWRAQLPANLDPDALTSDEVWMPDPAAALAQAVTHFDQALPHRSGEDRGLTLKAKAQALIWLAITGEQLQEREAAAAISEARALLDSERHAVHLATLEQLARYVAQHAGDEQTRAEPASAGRPAEIDQNSPRTFADTLWLVPEELADVEPKLTIVELWHHAAAAEQARRPEVAAALLRRIWPMVAQDRRGAAMANMVVHPLLTAWHNSFAVKDLVERAQGDLDAAAEQLRGRAAAQHWPPVRLAAGLTALAGRSTALDKEDKGLELIREARDLLGPASADLVEILDLFAGGLHVGVAVNRLNARDLAGCATAYGHAVGIYVTLDVEDLIVDTVDKLVDIGRRDEDAFVAMLVGLAVQNGRLSAGAGDARLSWLQRHWENIFARATVGPQLNPEMLWLVFQAVKGAAFAAQSLDRGTYRVARDPAALRLLDGIEELAEEAPPALPVGLREEDLLAAYIGDPKPAGAGEPGEIRRNLERRFDRHLQQQLARELREEAWLTPVDGLRERLGPRSALLSQHIGRTTDGRVALSSLLITPRDIFFFKGLLSLPPAVIQLGKDEESITVSWFALPVASLRQDIQEDPGPPGIVSDEAALTLAGDARNYLGGGLAERLRDLRAEGIDHLCIHPHGPLHFHPQHLLGEAPQTLADERIVTYLPHPALLGRHHPSAEPERAPLVAFGLGFAGSADPDLPPLPGAVDEAQAIARAAGGVACVEAEATGERLLEALLTARRVHIATHGRHEVAAPAFQHLQLTPSGGGNGRFHAYEVLGLDLAHVEVLTMSACTTSLGRFDLADALRGLPAFLLRAGVQSVIGTLWPIEDATSRHFFTTFHAALAGGASRLDAFGSAQLDTRRAFPAYRDWGAFHYAGSW